MVMLIKLYVFSRSQGPAALDMGWIANILLLLWKLISQHSNRHRSNHHLQSNYIDHENMHHGYIAPWKPSYTNRIDNGHLELHCSFQVHKAPPLLSIFDQEGRAMQDTVRLVEDIGG